MSNIIEKLNMDYFKQIEKSPIAEIVRGDGRLLYDKRQKSATPNIYGNIVCKLYVTDSKKYYLLIAIDEPSDRPICFLQATWYECIDSTEVDKLLDKVFIENASSILSRPIDERLMFICGYLKCSKCKLGHSVTLCKDGIKRSPRKYGRIINKLIKEQIAEREARLNNE